jgi:hypothetical protein
MDEQQRRLGTTTALVRRGPSNAVPPPPALPVIRSPSVPNRPARTLSPKRVRQLLGRDATVCEFAQDLSVDAARLDARNSLVLASHPCENGAYNYFYSAFIVDEAGRARPASFDVPAAKADLVNASWDPATRRLTSFSKGAGSVIAASARLMPGTARGFVWCTRKPWVSAGARPITSPPGALSSAKGGG